MEQKDYLMREIEKIGLIFRSIINNLKGSKEDLSISLAYLHEKARDMLLKEIGFDIDAYLKLDEQACKDYISRFDGMNAENLETLAEILYTLGVETIDGNKNVYLEKALELYEACKLQDKTFSFDRESKIERIKKVL